MKTATRIAFFVIALALLISCSAGVFLLAIAPANTLQAESESFFRFDSALADLQSEVYRNVASGASDAGSLRQSLPRAYPSLMPDPSPTRYDGSSLSASRWPAMPNPLSL
jgi:hypothetical protein